MEYTTIQIRKSTKEWLKSLGIKGESYEQIFAIMRSKDKEIREIIENERR